VRRLERYIEEAFLHLQRANEALMEIKDYENPSKIERFAMEVVVFRFSKLQDLLGQKIFRTYLEEIGFSTTGVSFDVILKELQKAGVIDIDRWALMRELRNAIAHEYPEDEESQLKNFRLAAKYLQEMEEIVKRIADAA